MLCLGLGISQSVTLLYQEVKGAGYRDGYTPLPVDATHAYTIELQPTLATDSTVPMMGWSPRSFLCQYALISITSAAGVHSEMQGSGCKEMPL